MCQKICKVPVCVIILSETALLAVRRLVSLVSVEVKSCLHYRFIVSVKIVRI
jgi:hypothetical protein